MRNDFGPAQFFELGDRLLRSWWTLVAGVSVGLSVSLLILQMTPRIYLAQTILDTESVKLTQHFQVPTTVGDFESQLENLKKAAGAEHHVERIAAEVFDLPDDAAGREAVLQSVRSGLRVHYHRVAGILRVNYQSDDPHIAAKIANTWAEIYREEYRRLRLGVAGENTRTLELVMDVAFRELEAKNEEILTFKDQHDGTLPEQLSMSQRHLESLEQELKDTRAAYAAAEERIRAIRDEQELQESLELMPSDGTLHLGTESDTPTELSELRRRLADLQVRYSDGHPEIRTLMHQIEEIERTSEEGPDSTVVLPREQPSPKSDTNLWKGGYTRVEQDRFDQLQNEENRIEAEIRRIRSLIDRTDVVQRELSELVLERDVLRRNYSEARSRVELARVAEVGEENQISGELVIQRRAWPPSKPMWPKPLPVMGGCIAAAVLLFIGPLVIRWFFFPVVGSEAGVLSLADVPVLVSVPRIVTSCTARLARRQRLKNFGLSFLSASILAGVVVVRWLGLG